MSTFTDTRAALAVALTDVAGVTGYELRPSVLKAGDAWPLLGTADRGPGDAWSATWRVIVCLGGDEAFAQTLLDDVLPDLVDVLDPVAYVEQATPVTVATSAGELFAVEVRCRAE